MAEGLSLVINNPSEGEFVKRIAWNKEEFMELVESITEKYSGLTYTEEQIPEAKKDRAELNAMKKAISDRRIQVKKAFMEPIDTFEREVKEVVSVIEERVSGIDKQVKEFEERQKQEKQQCLEEYFNEQVVEAKLNGLVPFEKIFDMKWLNASTSLKKAKEEIDTKLRQINTDLNSVNAFCEPEYRTSLHSFYLKTLDIRETLEERNRLKEIDKRAEEERLRKEEEEERQRQAESNVQQSVTEKVETVIEQAETVSEPVENVVTPTETATPEMGGSPRSGMTDHSVMQEEKQYKASFTVYGTKKQIMDLKQYMNDNNIRFGKVEK